MTTDKVGVLSAEDAETVGMVLDAYRALSRNDKATPKLVIPKLEAIRDGAHVVVPRMTEAQALKGFEHHWDYFGIGGSYHASKAVWMDALRSIGAIKGE